MVQTIEVGDWIDSPVDVSDATAAPDLFNRFGSDPAFSFQDALGIISRIKDGAKQVTLVPGGMTSEQPSAGSGERPTQDPEQPSTGSGSVDGGPASMFPSVPSGIGPAGLIAGAVAIVAVLLALGD